VTRRAMAVGPKAVRPGQSPRGNAGSNKDLAAIGTADTYFIRQGGGGLGRGHQPVPVLPRLPPHPPQGGLLPVPHRECYLKETLTPDGTAPRRETPAGLESVIDNYPKSPEASRPAEGERGQGYPRGPRDQGGRLVPQERAPGGGGALPRRPQQRTRLLEPSPPLLPHGEAL